PDEKTALVWARPMTASPDAPSAGGPGAAAGRPLGGVRPRGPRPLPRFRRPRQRAGDRMRARAQRLGCELGGYRAAADRPLPYPRPGPRRARPDPVGRTRG